MRSRFLALTLAVIALLATGAQARFVVMDANFDNRAAGSQLGRGGALLGEPVSGPFDMLDESVISEGAGDMAVRFPDARILGPSEMYFALRDNLAPVDGQLTARWTITAESVDDYRISLRGADLGAELVTVVFTDAGEVGLVDANDLLITIFDSYLAGDTFDFMIELRVADGTYTLWRNGTPIIGSGDHGQGAHDVGSLVFAHPDDGNATGAMVFDDLSVDWRPGDAPWLLDADFSDKPVGEVIQTRGAYYGEPVSLSGAEPYVAIGPPLGTKALVFEDLNDFSAQTARFEFFGGAEPTDQPVSISFALQVDQLDEYVVYVREQGTSAEVFLTVRLRESGQVQFSDAAGANYHIHNYTAGALQTVEMHFEPVLDVYSVWWNGERIIHRRAHGVVGREVGRIVFGHANDLDFDGILYLDRIRVHTLGQPVGVDDGTAPLAPATLLGAAPNPFNPATEIRFELPDTAPVTLDIFDSRGRHVRRLVDATLPAGRHTPVWRGTDDAGQRVASGVYHARVRAGGFSATTSMTLVK